MFKKKLVTLSLSFLMAASNIVAPMNVFATNSATTYSQEKSSETTNATTSATTAATTEKKTETTAATTEKKKITTTERKRTTTEKKKKTTERKKKTTTERKKKTTEKEKVTRKKKVKKVTDPQTQTKPKETTAPGAVENAATVSKNNKEYLEKYIYFNQGDAIWNNGIGLSIQSSGCGPSAVAVCITNLTGKWVTPVDTATYAYEQGLYSSAGSVHSAIPAMATHWGLKCTGLGTSYESIKASLKAGNPVVGLMGPGYFTGGGHFITLLEIDDNDKVLVADVGSRARTSKKYDLKYVIGQSKSASAGGPFWGMSKGKNTDATVKNLKSNGSSGLNEKSIVESKIIPVKVAKTKNEINTVISNFYLNTSKVFNDFEKKLPSNLIYVGQKRDINASVVNKMSKINYSIYNLGQQLNDSYLIHLSLNYDFGVDSVTNNGTKKTVDLRQYLQKKL